MDLFDDQDMPEPPRPTVRKPAPAVEPTAEIDGLAELARDLPSQLYLGTSSWSFPGWRGLVWRGDHTVSELSRLGLRAYSAHPLLRCVSLDRGFYRPLSASEFALYAGQVPDSFRFVVKAPSLVCDAVVRGSDGRGMQDNPVFLDPALAAADFVQPALEGLGEKIGALVFQLSPLSATWLAHMDQVLKRLAAFLAALPRLAPFAPAAVIAVEVRNPEFLTPAFAAVLRAAGAAYCVALHPRMPPIEEQLPMLRALWPGPLVCRWSLNRRHGAYGYEGAKGLYEPFDRLQDPDPATRAVLARLIAATTGAALPVYVTVNNKAEGCAPLSVLELAKSVRAGVDS